MNKLFFLFIPKIKIMQFLFLKHRLLEYAAQ